jgi:hypothetical protein
MITESYFYCLKKIALNAAIIQCNSQAIRDKKSIEGVKETTHSCWHFHSLLDILYQFFVFWSWRFMQL